jgi:hypothetical protein
MRLAQVINRLVRLPSRRSNLVYRLAYSERVGVWTFRRIGVWRASSTSSRPLAIIAVLKQSYYPRRRYTHTPTRLLYARRYTTLLRALLRINFWPTLGSFCWFARERKKAQTAEFSTDVRESSSFCLFIENDKSWSFRLRPPTGSRRRILQLLNSCNS